MQTCKDCTGFGWGECKSAKESDSACKDFELKPKQTNADRIRQMTDEELASILCGQCTCCAYQITDCTDKAHVGCEDGVLEWLKQESEVTE